MCQNVVFSNLIGILGSTDGRIHVWRTIDGVKLTTLSTDNSSDCIQCVQFNPKSFMLATASTNMVCFDLANRDLQTSLLQIFWLPPVDDE